MAELYTYMYMYVHAVWRVSLYFFPYMHVLVESWSRGALRVSESASGVKLRN